MNRSINTAGYGTSEGYAAQITLPNGKYMYTGVASLFELLSKEEGLEVKTVRYFGACIYANINDRAHDRFPIQIDGIPVTEFLEQIATDEECKSYFKAIPAHTEAV